MTDTKIDNVSNEESVISYDEKKGFFNKFLDWVENVGNRLPHPVTIFVIFAFGALVMSSIASYLELSAEYMRFGASGGTEKATINAINLLNGDGIRKIFSMAVKNFTGFAPLGTVLVAMLGVGVAEGSGLVNAVLRKIVLSAPKRLITVAVIFGGIMSNIASDAGYVVLVPLGAIVFLSFKRHPLAGLAAAFAGVSGGYSANLILGTIDPLLGGISQQAAQLVSPDYSVAPTANWYFMIVSTFIITGIGTYVTERIVEPRLGEYKGDAEDLDELTEKERKGLKAALITFALLVVTIAVMSVPVNGILRNQETGSLIVKSPFMAGLVPMIAAMFMLPGIAYGASSGTIKNDKDVAGFMSKAMAGMGGYLVLAFAAAQFIAYFKWSNLGTIFAVNGANFLKATGFTGLPLVIMFVVLSCFLNLFIGSASAKWAIMAPVFVPMFMFVGYTPEFTQAAYRIGDSCTNIISPLMAYFAVIVAFAQKYDKNIGIGTLISTMVPYSFAFMVCWMILFAIWFAFGLPLGPGAYIFMK